MQATAFRKHPLRHPVIGYREVFDQVEREDVVPVCPAAIRPEQLLCRHNRGCGTEAAIAAVQKHLSVPGSAGRMSRCFCRRSPGSRSRAGTARIFVTELPSLPRLGDSGRGGARQGGARCARLPAWFGRRSRLYQELREKRGIAHHVWAGAWAAQECGLFNVEVECDPDDAAAAERAVLEVIDRMKQKGPTPAELDEAVRSTLGGQLGPWPPRAGRPQASVTAGSPPAALNLPRSTSAPSSASPRRASVTSPGATSTRSA